MKGCGVAAARSQGKRWMPTPEKWLTVNVGTVWRRPSLFRVSGEVGRLVVG